MFKSEAKIFYYAPNATLEQKGSPYSDLDLTSDHYVLFEFRDSATQITFAKLSDQNFEMLHRFPLDKLPMVFNAIKTAELSDRYAYLFLGDYLHNLILGSAESEFSKVFQSIWPEYYAFYEGEQAKMRAVAQARAKKAAQVAEGIDK